MVDRPTPIEFLRYVSRAQPVLMTGKASRGHGRSRGDGLTARASPRDSPRSTAGASAGAASHWPALKRWTDEYLIERVGDRPITVAITPNGYADAVHDGCFVRPLEERMPLREFFSRLHAGPEVHYVQLQNSNLTSEFAVLLDDVEREFAFATEALGALATGVSGRNRGTASLTLGARGGDEASS